MRRRRMLVAPSNERALVPGVIRSVYRPVLRALRCFCVLGTAIDTVPALDTRRTTVATVLLPSLSWIRTALVPAGALNRVRRPLLRAVRSFMRVAADTDVRRSDGRVTVTGASTTGRWIW